jgi:hypothetical protein
MRKTHVHQFVKQIPIHTVVFTITQYNLPLLSSSHTTNRAQLLKLHYNQLHS